MTKEEILKVRDTAEQTRVQFKERVTRDNKYDVCCEMPEVTFENQESRHEFVVTFKRQDAQVGKREANGESNLEMHQEMHQVGDQASDQVSDQVSGQVNLPKSLLTKAQRDIVNYCSVPRTAVEILNRIGLTNHSVNRKRHILPLVEMGVLEMTNPGVPNDPNQKYRKVRRVKGKI